MVNTRSISKITETPKRVNSDGSPFVSEKRKAYIRKFVLDVRERDGNSIGKMTLAFVGGQCVVGDTPINTRISTKWAFQLKKNSSLGTNTRASQWKRKTYQARHWELERDYRLHDNVLTSAVTFAEKEYRKLSDDERLNRKESQERHDRALNWCKTPEEMKLRVDRERCLDRITDTKIYDMVDEESGDVVGTVDYASMNKDDLRHMTSMYRNCGHVTHADEDGEERKYSHSHHWSFKIDGDEESAVVSEYRDYERSRGLIEGREPVWEKCKDDLNCFDDVDFVSICVCGG